MAGKHLLIQLIHHKEVGMTRTKRDKTFFRIKQYETETTFTY